MIEFAPAPAPFRPSLWIGLVLYVTGQLADNAHEALDALDRVRESLEAVGW